MFPGLRTHERALQAGCKVAGATVHFVTTALDHGPIVIQSVVPVLPDDDAAALAERVLATEHSIYPRAVRWFVDEALRIDRGVGIDGDGDLLGIVLDVEMVVEAAAAQVIDQLVARDGAQPRLDRLRLVPGVAFQMHGKQRLLNDILAVGRAAPRR